MPRSLLATLIVLLVVAVASALFAFSEGTTRKSKSAAFLVFILALMGAAVSVVLAYLL
jgi:hypothetical protein